METTVTAELGRTRIQAYIEEVYTESVYRSAILQTVLRCGNLPIEIEFKAFYSAFLQLWQITRYSVVKPTSQSSEIANLDSNIEKWSKDHTAKEPWKEDAAILGISYFDSWVKTLASKGVVVCQ